MAGTRGKYDNNSEKAYLERLHERLRARLRDGAEVVDEVRLRHADASVHDRQRLNIFRHFCPENTPTNKRIFEEKALNERCSPSRPCWA